MELGHKILFRQLIIIFFTILSSLVSADDCSCCITEEYFNESIISYHISMLDIYLSSSQPIIYKYNINSANCQGNLSIDIEYKLVSSELGINTFETFYSGKIDLNSQYNYFTNNHIQSNSILNISGNKKIETLISFIGQTGSLPNGKYLFYFTLNSDADPYIIRKTVEIDVPRSLELLYPGGTKKDIYRSYIYNTEPTFAWLSDYCMKCEYAIRVSEYNPNFHQSLTDALLNQSILPSDQITKFLPIGSDINFYKYPSVGYYNLEPGKFYVWQIQRSYESSMNLEYDYSPIYLFEIRRPDKENIDYSDSYLITIESIIGAEQFNLLFGPGGKLEKFAISGETIIIDNEEIQIDGLYSILSDIKQKKIIIKDIIVK